ncbi:hypothetical protein [Methylocystis suflitae]|uniref:hypothetical protein n=1 Tax=Methylocystis suflitae TaxID=2951405 RepID=UPI00210B776D|nr:hypothetical protein [Methylocystis suflitae]MCQ4188299.1 hypothetical protein [Methylocystis suflitae]
MPHIFRLTWTLAVLVSASGLCLPALAQDDKPEAAREEKTEAKPAETTEAKPAEKTDAKHEEKQEKRAEKPTAKQTADHGAYLRKLGQLIRARSPGMTNLGEGKAVVHFHLGASGATDSVSVISATTPRHGELARSIVSGLRAPPPPGGSYQGVQSFRFH